MFIKYPENIKENILKLTYHPTEFNNKYGEFVDGDEGFITPFGNILHCGGMNHHEAIKMVLTDSYINDLSKYIKHRNLDDILTNSDDSVLVYDALDHGFVRFSTYSDNILEFGNKITRKTLDTIYDLVDYIIKQPLQIKIDAESKFIFTVAFNEGLDKNGNLIYSKNSIQYSSLDALDKKLINDIKRNVSII